MVTHGIFLTGLREGTVMLPPFTHGEMGNSEVLSNLFKDTQVGKSRPGVWDSRGCTWTKCFAQTCYTLFPLLAAPPSWKTISWFSVFACLAAIMVFTHLCWWFSWLSADDPFPTDFSICQWCHNSPIACLGPWHWKKKNNTKIWTHPAALSPTQSQAAFFLSLSLGNICSRQIHVTVCEPKGLCKLLLPEWDLPCFKWENWGLGKWSNLWRPEGRSVWGWALGTTHSIWELPERWNPLHSYSCVTPGLVQYRAHSKCSSFLKTVCFHFIYLLRLSPSIPPPWSSHT